jgi:hypothetical protein
MGVAAATGCGLRVTAVVATAAEPRANDRRVSIMVETSKVSTRDLPR